MELAAAWDTYGAHALIGTGALIVLRLAYLLGGLCTWALQHLAYRRWQTWYLTLSGADQKALLETGTLNPPPAPTGPGRAARAPWAPRAPGSNETT